MRQFYLDTNIILDLLLNREPFADAAEKLFDAAAQQQVKLLVSSLTFVTVHYVLSKKIGKAAATESLASLATQVIILPVDASAIETSLQHNSADFEDTVQLIIAIAAGAQAIITRDPKGFRHSFLPVFDALVALQQL